MKIAAHVHGYIQTSENVFNPRIDTYIFDSSVTIDEIMRVTKQSDLSILNLSTVVEEKPE